jgi:hypothetical protein
MRWIHLTVIALFAVATLVFAVQNLQTVTMAFLGFSVRLPLALQAVVIYLLGMVTGGSLLALLRRSLEGSLEHFPAKACPRPRLPAPAAAVCYAPAPLSLEPQ